MPDMREHQAAVGPGMGDYQGFVTAGEQPWAGVLPAGAASAGRWIPYVVVDDLDAAAKQAIGLGGSMSRRPVLRLPGPAHRGAAGQAARSAGG